MSDRKFDFVVYGATGFTGVRVAKELLRGVPIQDHKRIALAGRHAQRLKAVQQQLGSPHVQVLDGVDSSNFASVLAMAQQTRVVLNCVGPFRYYGEAVVKACVQSGTHYLDVCGEPEFMERMELQYHSAARDAACFVVSAVGFDSVPADVGTLLAARELQRRAAVPSSVEAFISILTGPAGAKGHYATWQSAVEGFGSVKQLRDMRRAAKANGVLPQPKHVGRKPPRRGVLTWEPSLACWVLPFPGADAAVVRRTQARLSGAGEPAVHFSANFTVTSLLAAVTVVFYGALLSLLASAAAGRRLLLRYPGVFSGGFFSHDGPTEEQMASTRCRAVLVARGYSDANAASTDVPPDTKVTVQMDAPEPGYVATPIFIVHAALALLQHEQQLLRAERGGVVTPAYLLRNTDYVQRLAARGITFQTL